MRYIDMWNSPSDRDYYGEMPEPEPCLECREAPCVCEPEPEPPEDLYQDWTASYADDVREPEPVCRFCGLTSTECDCDYEGSMFQGVNSTQLPDVYKP